ncbi:hypothetical protein [Flavobacterium sp.]|uniref:hypothetical protein n=1 Tax=Flavobacterium sp. TaxID=239 RepID=UPI002C516B6B|nr:hypothetical protein [Flavobacterium sp.]HSD05991.1 hypothetical protein [Flavobacterium sp.]
MKKIITILTVIAMFGFQACEGPEGPEGPPGEAGPNSEVFEVSGVKFDTTNGYAPLIPLNPAIQASDMVLVYRLSGSTNTGADIWKLLPETYYFDDGTKNFGYNFDFSINDVSIFLEGNDLATVGNEYRLNQVFRIVIIPGYLTYASTGKNANTKKIDYSDYNAVIKVYNVDDSNVKVLKY